MQTLALSAKRYLNAAVLVFFLAAVALPSILAGRVSADLIQNRSITLSSATASATPVTYLVSFDIATTGDIRSIIVDFDGLSPIIQQSGTTVPGLTIPGTPTIAAHDDNQVGGTWSAALVSPDAIAFTAAADVAVTAAQTFAYEVEGITNPSALGTFYARILTFPTAADATNYEAGDPDSYNAAIDAGGVALSITDEIGVTAIVRETLTFTVTDTALELGHGTPVPALDTTAVDEDTATFALSTNASGSTSINIKSDSIDLESGSQSIPGAVVGAAPGALISHDTALGAFGFRVAGDAAFDFATRYASATEGHGNIHADVTTVYGDQIAETTGPVLNVDGTITFAAIAGSQTPAGIYTGAFSLIATPSY